MDQLVCGILRMEKVRMSHLPFAMDGFDLNTMIKSIRPRCIFVLFWNDYNVIQNCSRYSKLERFSFLFFFVLGGQFVWFFFIMRMVSGYRRLTQGWKKIWNRVCVSIQNIHSNEIWSNIQCVKLFFLFIASSAHKLQP